MAFIDTYLKQLIKSRINPYSSDLIKFMLENRLKSIHIGGGAFNQDSFNDFDIYPVNKDDFKQLTYKSTPLLKTSTKTQQILFKDKVFQFCNYHKDTLKGLVHSFDFSHVQVGCTYSFSEEIIDVQYTDLFMEYKISQKSVYAASEYPFSSLVRLKKYSDRGLIQSYTNELASILIDVIRRGVKNQEDWKDQLTAIDLNIEENAHLKELGQLLIK